MDEVGFRFWGSVSMRRHGAEHDVALFSGDMMYIPWLATSRSSLQIMLMEATAFGCRGPDIKSTSFVFRPALYAATWAGSCRTLEVVILPIARLVEILTIVDAYVEQHRNDE